MRVNINFDIVERLKEHEEKIKNAFAAAQNLERFTNDDKFLILGHLKAVCFFAAEDFIRAQMLICDKEKRDDLLLNELKSVSGFYHNGGKKPIDKDFMRGVIHEAT